MATSPIAHRGYISGLVKIGSKLAACLFMLMAVLAPMSALIQTFFVSALTLAEFFGAHKTMPS